MSEKRYIQKEDLLKPENMLLLYSKGAFPMSDDHGEVNWYLPETRTIIPLDNFNFPRTLRKFIEKSDFEFKYDHDPLRIIKKCSERKRTWISDTLIEAYKNLIKFGNLHSVEVYKNNKLGGGLYGITYKGAFFGESMFSTISQASKAALIKLIERLRIKKYVLLDVQFLTPHLKMFGAAEISFEEFHKLLLKARLREASFI